MASLEDPTTRNDSIFLNESDEEADETDDFDNESEGITPKSNKIKIRPIDESFTPKQLTIATPNMVRKVSATHLAKIHNEFGRSTLRRLSSHQEPHNETKVLILYTGGTIGMRCKDGVYSPEPHFLPKVIAELPPLNDHEYVDHFYADATIKPYCLPPLRGMKNRVVYWLVEYDPLLDSSDMTFDDWIRIANDIKKSYVNYDGFVVLHGTDTLAYTACALSFMMEHLGKPVIVTGSQIPVGEVRSDGRENLIGALIIAGNLDVPEVCVYFNNKLLRGNRTTKLDNSGLEAFVSPNASPLAQMDITVNVKWESIFRSNEIAPFDVHDDLCRSVGILRIFPSMPIESVQAAFRPSVQGVVIQTYGSGNIPVRRTDIINEIHMAVERGCLVLNVSQCLKGHVTSDYETGKVLLDAGAIPGSDMTTEAALTKLAYVLGKDCDLATKRQMLQQSLRGELTISQPEKLNELDIIPRLAKFLHITSSHESKLLKEALFPPLVSHAAHTDDTRLLESLRLSGANLSNADYSSRTALHIAAAGGHLASVDYLLRHGVSVHVRDNDHENSLQAAIRSRNLPVIEALRRAGAHLSFPPVKIGTELCMSASMEDIHTLRAWLAAGASLNEPDYDGRTALHVALTSGLDEVVEWLCEHGADPFVRDNFGQRPVDAATSCSDRIRLIINKTSERLSPQQKPKPIFELP